MNKILPFLVISRYNEDCSWMNKYKINNYMIVNKGNPMEESHQVRNVPNIGANQIDICQFIYENYSFLPKLIAFIQAEPFEHCRKETFDKIINNKNFTPLEDYSHIPEGNGHKKDVDGGYMEINSSWYIPAHNETFGLTCNYSSYDQFMEKYFIDYKHLEWLRFTPGSQYLIDRKQAWYYPRKFWFYLMNELNNGRNPTEGHIIERALWYIFNGTFELKEEYK